MAEKSVAEQVADLRAKWNPPAEDKGFERIVGKRVPEGDTRATAHARDERLDQGFNPGDDGTDAGRRGLYEDDADEGGENTESYDDMNVKELKAEIDRRNEGRDEGDHLSKTGNKADLVARLEEDDDNAGSDDDDDDEDEDDED